MTIRKTPRAKTFMWWTLAISSAVVATDLAVRFTIDTYVSIVATLK